MNILLICGSARDHSCTGIVAQYIMDYNYPSHINIDCFDINKFDLPIYQGTEEQYAHPHVEHLLQCAEKADAFIICTPEYHSGISGALKNLLDYLDVEHFRRKNVQIFAIAGGGKGGINALNQLRIILRALHAVTLPQQFIIDAPKVDTNRRFIDEDTRNTMESVLEEFIIFFEKTKK